MQTTTEAPPARSHPIAPERVTVALEGWNAADLDSPELLRRSLTSLRDQSFPIARAELLVVFDAGAPAADEMVRELLPGARVVKLEDFTYYRCKNLALREARGDFLLLADSDVAYDREWMWRMLAAFSSGALLVAGRTRYARGFLSRTIDLCDGGMVRSEDGPTEGFYAHNVALRRELFEGLRFDERMGLSGGGAVEAMKAELAGRGIRPWFAAGALAEHPLPGFVQKRLRVGSFHMHCRGLSRDVPGAVLARVPLAAPLLVCAGVLVRTWTRVWRRRSELPGGVAAVPIFLLTTAFARSIEIVGACCYSWAPWLLQERTRWHDVNGADGPPLRDVS